MTIELHNTPNYSSNIEISVVNKNFKILSKIDNVLKSNNQNWNWLIENTGISFNTFKTYFSGGENISLYAIEIISIVLDKYINSPKDLMDENKPVLKLGRDFNLNIKEICQKYKITHGDIIIGTGIDRGAISMIVNSKTKQIREDRILILFDFFNSKGVPLKSALDLIYFPCWNEKPLDFISKKSNIRGLLFKYNSHIKVA